ncbi:hypothetical protein LZ554_002587 [Drepanopeziza brunnea f. sp. 'monogermtubi']|nr:hypothetical protein LZ554_002587 [Drepanopeziza brunnea f. sp. 'monogermtubi']
MAPKRSLVGSQPDEQMAKRAKSSATPSRSATPADMSPKMPFMVEYPPSSIGQTLTQAQRDLVRSAEFQVSPFKAKGAKKEGEMDQSYVVTPHKEWESMRKYSNFIIEGETYKNSDTVFVRGEGTPKDNNTWGKPKDFWVARVLEVRAKNAQHVYALVTWMYWPEELPPPATKSADQVNRESGKRTYHGRNEVVASNYMEVLDVLSFAGKAEMAQWLEEDGAPQSSLYWRQTYNRSTQELSALKKRCLCGGHENPDVPMMICDNSQCKTYFHINHLEDAVAKVIYEREIDDKPAKGKGKAPWKRFFSVVVDEPPNDHPKAVVKSLRADKKKWEERLKCPICNHPFEQASP